MDQRLWVFGGWRVSISWQVFHFILSLPPGLRGDLLKHLMFSFGHCPIAKSVMFCHISRHFIMWDISHLDQWIWLVLFNFPLFFFYPASASLWVFQLISSVRSSSVHHALIEIFKFSNLEQSCLYTFIIHFHFHSVFNIQNKFLQGSSDFSETQHVLYFLNAWG